MNNFIIIKRNLIAMKKLKSNRRNLIDELDDHLHHHLHRHQLDDNKKPAAENIEDYMSRKIAKVTLKDLGK